MCKRGAMKGSHLLLGLSVWCFLLLLSVTCVKNKSEVLKNTVPGRVYSVPTAGPGTDTFYPKSEYHQQHFTFLSF